MKKLFSIVCAGALMTLATACGGNKAANDSDSIAPDSTVGVVMDETIAEGESVVAPENEVQEAAAESEAVNGAKKTATKAANKAKDTAKEVADKATDKTTEAAKAAVKATKEAAKTATKEAKESEKAKALREKMNKQ